MNYDSPKLASQTRQGQSTLAIFSLFCPCTVLEHLSHPVRTPLVLPSSLFSTYPVLQPLFTLSCDNTCAPANIFQDALLPPKTSPSYLVWGCPWSCPAFAFIGCMQGPFLLPPSHRESSHTLCWAATGPVQHQTGARQLGIADNAALPGLTPI